MEEAAGFVFTEEKVPVFTTQQAGVVQSIMALFGVCISSFLFTKKQFFLTLAFLLFPFFLSLQFKKHRVRRDNGSADRIKPER